MPDDDGTDTATDDSTTDTSSNDDAGSTSTDHDTSTDTTSGEDPEVAKWKAMARKHEKESKAAAAELDKIRKANLSDTEKAIEEAKAAGRAEATTGYGTKLAAAELRAAGVPAEIVGDLDLSKFIDADGEVDAVKVAEVGGRYKALATPGPGSADGGPQGDPPPNPSLDQKIAEAQAKGDWKTVISLNSQKLAAVAAGS